MRDRSSVPGRVPHRTPVDRVEAIERLRRLRMTAAEIAECLGIALSTVSAVLARIGLGKLSRLQPPEPPNRYQRRHPGELLHVDVKKLARIPAWGAGHRVHGNRRLQRKPTKTNAAGQRQGTIGWEYVHVCVDDATRLAYAEVLTDEKATTAIAFLRRAVAFYSAHGIATQRVIPTTARPTARSRTRSPAAHSASGTSAPGPIGRRPTARPNGSSRPSSPAGTTARSTAQATNAPPPLTAGYGPTTIAGDTAPSATRPRSPASAN